MTATYVDHFGSKQFIEQLLFLFHALKDPYLFLTRIISYLFTVVGLPTYLPTYLPNYIHTYIPTYLHTYLPTYIPTYLPTYIPTYIHTYLPSHETLKRLIFRVNK